MAKKEKKKSSMAWIYGLVGVMVVVLVVILLMSTPKNTLSNKEVTPESKLDVKELFNCEGKNRFLSDCWKKLQIVDKQIVYNLSTGEDLTVKFAMMNRLNDKALFSYAVSSLNAVDLVREGCPKPLEADAYISSSKGEKGISLDVNETASYDVTISAPSITTPAKGCSYRYVIDVKRNDLFYEKTYFDVLIK